MPRTPLIWVNGNALANQIAQTLRQQILQQRQLNSTFYNSKKKWSSPQLHIINAGFDDAALSYIKKKIDLANQIGVRFQLHQFMDKLVPEQRLHKTFMKIYKQSSPQNFRIHQFNSQDPSKCFNQISSLFYKLNRRAQVSGILMQLPLPANLTQYTRQIIDRIQPLKDVDCLSIDNRAKVIQHGQPQLMPCTPSAVLKILDAYNIDVSGKKVVIAGRSLLVGLPLFHLLLNRNATITLCHQHTQNLNDLTAQADIVISAVGKANLITQLKQGSVAIDVGISRNKKRLCGDISAQAKERCSLATPVPGGVGPLTVVTLMENTVKLWRAQMRLQQSRHQI